MPILPRRERARAKTNGRCWYCGDPLKHTWIVQRIDPDLPVKRGTVDNLAAVCHSCHSLKAKYDEAEFRIRLSRRCEGMPVFSKEQRRWLAEKYGVDPYEHDIEFHEHHIFYGEWRDIQAWLDSHEAEGQGGAA